MAQFHHGISKKDPASGIIPMRDASTNIIALIAFSDNANEEFFQLNTPTLVTSINRALAASGTEGNLRSSLEAISAITSPTLVVIRIADPFSGASEDALNQSLVIGSTLETGQRTGLQALLTVKSILGITPKIIIAPDVETSDVVKAIAAICKKLRAFAYVTPRDEYGIMLQNMEDVTRYRDTLSDREIMLIWPEFTSGNVLLGIDEVTPTGITTSSQPTFDNFSLTFDLYRNNQLLQSDHTVLVNEELNASEAFVTAVNTILMSYPDIRVIGSGGGIGQFAEYQSRQINGTWGPLDKDLIHFVFKANTLEQNDLFPLLVYVENEDFPPRIKETKRIDLISLGNKQFIGV